MFDLIRKEWWCTKQQGFSLVEMIIVMAMLGIVLLAVMSLYIPAVRSTSVQTELSDMQANHRLAINRMTKDLLLAGFLVSPGYTTGGTAGPIYWQGDVSPKDTDDLTIRTRAVGNTFARIIANTNTGVLGLSDTDMAAAFPIGTKIRIFEAMTAMEAEAMAAGGTYNEDDPSDYNDFVYTVAANNPAPGTVDGISCQANIAVTPIPAGDLKEAIILKAGQRPMQTIRYRVDNGALERIVNGVTQILARNVDSVLFGYVDSVTGAVKRVDVTLTGQTAGLSGGGIESTAKDRQLRTSVALRNVY